MKKIRREDFVTQEDYAAACESQEIWDVKPWDVKPTHILINDEKSFCPNCGYNPDLLMAVEPEINADVAFYVCWTCKEIRQIGVGLVKRETT